MKKNVEVEEKARVVKVLLEECGTYIEFDNDVIDMFLNFIMKDILFLKGKLAWAKVNNKPMTIELESAESMIEELGVLAYNFVKYALRYEKKPISTSYIHKSLKQLGKFEKYLYSGPIYRDDMTEVILLGAETYFDRLGMLGLSRKTVMEIPVLKDIKDFITQITLHYIPGRDSYIAALIVAAQDYVFNLSEYRKQGNCEEKLEREEEILAERVLRIREQVAVLAGPQVGKRFVIDEQN